MGEHICFRRNERLATVNPYWRGNPMVRGRFFNRQHRFRPGMGSVLKWRLSPNPQRKEKKTVKWDPKVCYLRSLDAVVGDSLIWLGHNSFFLQLAGKRIMFDPVFGNIPFVKRQSEFPANPDIFTEIDYLLISHDHFDHLDKQSITRLLNNNPQMKLFCGLGTGELIKSWFPEMRVIEAGWYQQLEDEGLKITFLPAQHWSKRSVRDGGQRLWGAFMLQGNGVSLYYSGDTGYSTHFREIPDLVQELRPDIVLRKGRQRGIEFGAFGELFLIVCITGNVIFHLIMSRACVRNLGLSPLSLPWDSGRELKSSLRIVRRGGIRFPNVCLLYRHGAHSRIMPVYSFRHIWWKVNRVTGNHSVPLLRNRLQW